MIRYIEDQILARLQGRCTHPGEMVAVDILDGCGAGVTVGYCRRCGSVRVTWAPKHAEQAPKQEVWRRPAPNLWRG